MWLHGAVFVLCVCAVLHVYLCSCVCVVSANVLSLVLCVFRVQGDCVYIFCVQLYVFHSYGGVSEASLSILLLVCGCTLQACYITISTAVTSDLVRV